MITESGGKEDIVHPELKSLNSFAELLKGVKPLEGNPFRGLGKRKYIQIKLKTHNIAFEFFAESVISPAPADSSIGYEQSDIKQQYGVIRYDITNDTDNIDERNFVGDFIEFGDFLEQYTSGGNVRHSLTRYMDMLIDASQLSETYLTNMNKLWGDREINTPGIYSTTIC